MPYVRPEDVRSPKAHWQQIDVLADNGPGGGAYALGEWDGERRIGFRWNGTDDNRLGNPQSRGLATWTMLDPQLHEAVLAMIPPEKRSLARRFLGLDVRFEGVSLSEDRAAVLLWDVRRTPLVVARLDCAVLRNVLSLSEVSDDDCRLLVDRNKDILAELTEAMLSDHRFTDQKNLRIVTIEAPDLSLVAGRFSTTVLEMAAQVRWFR